MEEKLKPCPFCGGKARLGKKFYGEIIWSVVSCVNCFASGPKYVIRDGCTEDIRAKRAWNRRQEAEQ